MKIKFIKLISIIMLAVMIMTTISGMLSVQATDSKVPNIQETKIDDISVQEPDQFADDVGKAPQGPRIVMAILTITQVIGVGIAVIMLIVSVIKYIFAAPNDKAEIKKHIVIYIVIAISLLAFAEIIEIIRNPVDIIQP